MAGASRFTAVFATVGTLGLGAMALTALPGCVEEEAVCVDDDFEDDDTPETAAERARDEVRVACPGDDDLVRFTYGFSREMRVSVAAASLEGELELHVSGPYDRTRSDVGGADFSYWGTCDTNAEDADGYITVVNTTDEPIDYVIDVSTGFGHCNDE